VLVHTECTHKDLWKNNVVVCVGFLMKEPKNQLDSEGKI
jgi:hypothetical protein